LKKDINGVFFTPLELTYEKDTVNSNIVQLFDEAGILVVMMDRDIIYFPSRSKYDLVGVENFRIQDPTQKARAVLLNG
jgi:GntR family transcriptional regulator, arabinose operon transcriptional repressor